MDWVVWLLVGTGAVYVMTGVGIACIFLAASLGVYLHWISAGTHWFLWLPVGEGFLVSVLVSLRISFYGISHVPDWTDWSLIVAGIAASIHILLRIFVRELFDAGDLGPD